MSLDFKLSHDKDFKPYVAIPGSDRKFYKWPEIGEDFPDIPKQARRDETLLGLLAQAFDHLSQSRQKLVISEEKLAKEIENWAEPGLEKLRRWYAGESISGPPPGSMAGPLWDEDDLILYTYNFDWGGASRYLFGAKVRLSFGETWAVNRENLKDQESLPLTKTSSRAEELFGGKVGGFLKAHPPLCKERLYLSVDREERAVPYVWWPEGTEPKRYTSFAKLCEDHPEAGEEKLLAHLGGEIETYWGDRGIRHHNYSCIADGAAYLEEYRSKNWGTFKLRYWVDQLATWKLDVPELESVASPSVENDVLTAYFKGDKYQPCRMVIDLCKLSLSENPKIETMATETLISDTGGYHGGLTSSPSPLDEPEINEPIPLRPAKTKLDLPLPPPRPKPMKDLGFDESEF